LFLATGFFFAVGFFFTAMVFPFYATTTLPTVLWLQANDLAIAATVSSAQPLRTMA
jgi:hypothetical protein